MRKYKLLTALVIFFIILAIVFIAIFSNNGIDISNAKVKVIEYDYDSNISAEVELSASDSKEISKILCNKQYYEDSPSCPFGYFEVIISDDDSMIKFFPSTDSCTLICKEDSNGNYTFCRLSDKEWKSLFEILNKYDIYFKTMI